MAFQFADSLAFQHQTIQGAGVTGNKTVNKMTGNVRIAATGNTVTVTNSLVTATSQVMCQLATVDSVALSLVCVPGSGSFVITLNGNANAEVNINWVVMN